MYFLIINDQWPKEGKDLQENIQETADEDLLDATTVEQKLNNPDGLYSADDIDIIKVNVNNSSDKSYEQRIQDALFIFNDNKDRYLTPKGLEIYSPKFLNILENINDSEYKGMHLIYSQFRTLEGIGIFKLILETNGYTQFSIKKNDSGSWILDIKEKDVGKPMFALYTGTESVEEKEIIRNIYNSNWEFVPETILTSLRPISSNNFYGEIIKY